MAGEVQHHGHPAGVVVGAGKPRIPSHHPQMVIMRGENQHGIREFLPFEITGNIHHPVSGIKLRIHNDGRIFRFSRKRLPQHFNNRIVQLPEARRYTPDKLFALIHHQVSPGTGVIGTQHGICLSGCCPFKQTFIK